jgi:hypothetical protein
MARLAMLQLFRVKWMPVRVEAMPALPGCGPANGDPIIGPGNHNRRRCTAQVRDRVFSGVIYSKSMSNFFEKMFNL